MNNATEVWRTRLEAELKDNILGFWMKHALDDTHGGFIGEMDNQLQVLPGADKSLVLNARILWTFASAYSVYRTADYLAMADRAYDYLIQHFTDSEFGGFFWLVDEHGSASQPKKQIYGLAFVIYALAEYYHATGRDDVLRQATQLFHLIEKYGYDPLHKGYIEALSREWEMTDSLSLSAKDMNEKNP